MKWSVDDLIKFIPKLSQAASKAEQKITNFRVEILYVGFDVKALLKELCDRVNESGVSEGKFAEHMIHLITLFYTRGNNYKKFKETMSPAGYKIVEDLIHIYGIQASSKGNKLSLSRLSLILPTVSLEIFYSFYKNDFVKVIADEFPLFPSMAPFCCNVIPSLLDEEMIEFNSVFMTIYVLYQCYNSKMLSNDKTKTVNSYFETVCNIAKVSFSSTRTVTKAETNDIMVKISNMMRKWTAEKTKLFINSHKSIASGKSIKFPLIAPLFATGSDEDERWDEYSKVVESGVDPTS